LEILENLTAEAFIQAMRRHIADHGRPATVRLDNFRAHVAMQGEIDKLLSKSFEHDVHGQAVKLGIKWSWSSAYMPNTNGVVERMVQNVKRALKRTIGKRRLTYIELLTLAREAKSLINSRPLVTSRGPTGLAEAITPNHLVYGHPLSSLPLKETREEEGKYVTPSMRWEMRQKLRKQYAQNFMDLYIRQLQVQATKKWNTPERPTRPGDICLISEPNQKRLHWPIGKVIDVHVGTDGVIRNCRLKTATGETQRSVRSLVLLRPAEGYDHEDNVDKEENEKRTDGESQGVGPQIPSPSKKVTERQLERARRRARVTSTATGNQPATKRSSPDQPAMAKPTSGPSPTPRPPPDPPPRERRNKGPKWRYCCLVKGKVCAHHK